MRLKFKEQVLIGVMIIAMASAMFIVGHMVGMSTGIQQVEMATLKQCIESCSVFTKWSWVAI